MPGQKSIHSVDKGASPARFKNFVRDIKGATKGLRRHRHMNSKDFTAPKQPFPTGELNSTTEDFAVPNIPPKEQPQPPAEELVPPPTATETISVSDIPPKQEPQVEEPAVAAEDPVGSDVEDDVDDDDERSLFRDGPNVRSLSIRVTVGFGDPLNYSHSQDYEASSSLQPTEELCEALLRRVDHCCQELITRKDSNALDRTDIDGKAKPLRFEIQTQVLRHDIATGTEAWASRTLRSYQKQPLGTSAAREVVLTTHYMIGLFLRHHDDAFFWRECAIRPDPMQEDKSFRYQPARVQPLTTIPRSYFIEKQQCFESTPGYTIKFSITSQSHHRTPPQWSDTIEVESHQLTPLTFARAESLFLDACYAVDGAFMKERKAYESLQAPCANHTTCSNCRQHEGNGVKIVVSVNNNVGPLFDNLERTTQASINMFRKSQAKDCIEFVDTIKAALEQVRHETDEFISQKNDFEFFVTELRGQDWTTDEPLIFRLGPEICLDRRTVEALLDRLQTGVAEILQGYAISVRISARKRGHFILHKTLVAREPIEKPGLKKKTQNKSKAYIVDRLKQRIEHDIDMVCKDTCSIVDPEIEQAKINGLASSSSQAHSMNDTASTTSKKLSDLTVPSNHSADHERNSSVGKLGSIRSVSSDKPESSSASSSVSPRPGTRGTGETRDPTTGVRLSPLLLDGLVQSELKTIDSELVALNNNLPMNGTTDKSSDGPMSHRKSHTSFTQPTSDPTVLKRQGASKTSLAGSHSHEQWYTREESASIRPQTPSLESGSSQSIRSSTVHSERTHEHAPNSEVAIMRSSTPDIMTGDDVSPEHVENYPKKFYIGRSTPSIPRPLSQVSSVPSSISETRSAPKEQPLRGPGSDRASSIHESGASSQPWPEYYAARNKRPELNGRRNTSPAKPTARPTVPLPRLASPSKPQPKKDSPSEETKPENKTSPESKPDLDSTPTASDTNDDKPTTNTSEKSPSESDSSQTTSDTSNGESSHDLSSLDSDHATPAQNHQTEEFQDPITSDDLSEADDVLGRSALTLLPQPRLNLKSFSGTSYLGGYSLGLRRPSVMGTSTPPRPFTPGSPHDTEGMPAVTEVPENADSSDA